MHLVAPRACQCPWKERIPAPSTARLGNCALPSAPSLEGSGMMAGCEWRRSPPFGGLSPSPSLAPADKLRSSFNAPPALARMAARPAKAAKSARMSRSARVNSIKMALRAPNCTRERPRHTMRNLLPHANTSPIGRAANTRPRESHTMCACEVWSAVRGAVRCVCVYARVRAGVLAFAQ